MQWYTVRIYVVWYLLVTVFGIFYNLAHLEGYTDRWYFRNYETVHSSMYI